MFEDETVTYEEIESEFDDMGNYKSAKSYYARANAYKKFAKLPEIVKLECVFAQDGSYLVMKKVEYTSGKWKGWKKDELSDGVLTSGIPLDKSDEEVHQIVEEFASKYNAEIEIYDEADKETLKRRT